MKKLLCVSLICCSLFAMEQRLNSRYPLRATAQRKKRELEAAKHSELAVQRKIAKSHSEDDLKNIKLTEEDSFVIIEVERDETKDEDSSEIIRGPRIDFAYGAEEHASGLFAHNEQLPGDTQFS